MNLIFPISLFFTRSFLWLYAFYSAPTLPRQLRPGVTFSLSTAFLLQNVVSWAWGITAYEYRFPVRYT